jgi:purine nucleosidase
MGGDSSQPKTDTAPQTPPGPELPNCLSKYLHAGRICPYRSERLEISEDEASLLAALPRGPVSPQPAPSLPGPCRLIIDTDIGSDLDDALALLFALRLPNLELVGVTTNYAVSTIRSGVAKAIIAAHRSARPSAPEIPVVAGSSRPLGTHRAFFLTGEEGRPILAPDFIAENGVHKMNHIEQFEAADFIAEKVLERPGEVTVCSIGIPTNIALALQRHPQIKDLIKELVVMGGGSFFRGEQKLEDGATTLAGEPVNLFPNHNLSGDSAASALIFRELRCPIRVIPFAATSKFWLAGPAIEHLKEKAQSEPDSAAGIVGRLMAVWFGRRHGQTGQCPHDPLTVNEACFGSEGCLRYIRGQYVVHEWAAFATFVPHADGPHYLAVDVADHDGFLAQLTAVLTEE